MSLFANAEGYIWCRQLCLQAEFEIQVELWVGTQNFRHPLKTTEPPSDSSGLGARAAPRPSAHGQGTMQKQQNQGSTCPPHRHLPAGMCAPGLQHLSSCAHTQLRPHQLLNAALHFWELNFRQQESRQPISRNGAVQTFVL